ncbi:MAG: hypothetical protein FJY67_04015 [Calditrichaeota bacterium]|nr:hypothetical protein [Calditrichota bacterium]
MHLFAWAFIGFIGLAFLIAGRSPFPVFFGRSGGKSWPDPASLWLRLVGFCFTVAAALPVIMADRIGHAIWISVQLISAGIVILLIGMLRGASRRAS